jgi:DNA-binding NtrC family response regulator
MADKVLMIDDDLTSIWGFTEALTRHGYEVSRCGDPRQAVDVFVREKPDVVLLDVKMSGRSGLEILKDIRERDGNVCVIMLSAFGDSSIVVDALKLRADNFAEKNLDPEKLVFMLEKELKTKHLEAQLRGFKGGGDITSLRLIGNIIGESEAMKAVKRQIREYAEYSAGDCLAVLITGESGVGKNVVAEALHTLSDRRDKPFKHLNCSNLQSPLVESELFGYEKGAFTDAYRSKKGLIETARGGTVFLDEIGVLTTDIQAKLLLLTETGVYFRLGAEGASKQADAWFLTATNIDMPRAIQSGKFREDLYYRLNQAWIHVPPLRDRGDDVILLAEHFIRLEAERAHKPPIAMTPEYMEALLAYRWPGNVRQLQSVIRRYMRSDGKDQRLHSATFESAAPDREDRPTTESLPEALARTKEETERRLISAALARFGGNRTKAAGALGISRRSLMYKIKQYGLHGRT